MSDTSAENAGRGQSPAAMPEPRSLNIEEILRILPHRYPFLLVDRILELQPGRVVARKCVSINEPYFQGHFPGRPIMPGVLQLEAMAQAGAVLESLYPDRQGKLLVLAAIDETRFRRPIVPGDVLRIEIEEVFRRKSIGRNRGRILVDGEVACEGVVTFGVTDMPR